MSTVRIVCLSDTHERGRQITVPDGDIVIHAGDLSMMGREQDVCPELDWFASLPHAHKLLLGGNHDFALYDKAPRMFRSWKLKPMASVDEIQERYPSITFLHRRWMAFKGLSFYGDSSVPHYDGWAFEFPAIDGDKAARTAWKLVPKNVDVLVTHTPPNGILDRSASWDKRHGCPHLRESLEELSHLRLHVFGHIHESYGEVTETIAGRPVHFVNAAVNNLDYKPVNAPIVVDIEI